MQVFITVFKSEEKCLHSINIPCDSFYPLIKKFYTKQQRASLRLRNAFECFMSWDTLHYEGGCSTCAQKKANASGRTGVAPSWTNT